MKKIIFYFILSSFIITCFNSCDWFRIDNYDAPDQTVWGYIIDKNHPNGPQPVLTDQGSDDGIRIRLQELSWSETAEYHYFRCMPSGMYRNTAVFAGYYNIDVWGPFIPLIRTRSNGTVIEDNSIYTDIRGGTTQIDIEVEPFLRVEWVEEPQITGNQITVKFKVTRGVSVERLQQMLGETGAWAANSPDLISLYLFCSETKDVGNSQGQSYWRQIQFPSGDTPDYPNWPANSTFDSVLGFGQTITMTTTAVPPGHTVFVRCAARIRYQNNGVARMNYNEAKRVDMPK